MPYAGLLSYVVLGAVAGVVAALLPARRAARLNVLEAIAAD
jgi:putative ABC transport system permease protein